MLGFKKHKMYEAIRRISESKMKRMANIVVSIVEKLIPALKEFSRLAKVIEESQKNSRNSETLGLDMSNMLMYSSQMLLVALTLGGHALPAESNYDKIMKLAWIKVKDTAIDACELAKAVNDTLSDVTVLDPQTKEFLQEEKTALENMLNELAKMLEKQGSTDAEEVREILKTYYRNNKDDHGGEDDGSAGGEGIRA